MNEKPSALSRQLAAVLTPPRSRRADRVLRDSRRARAQANPGRPIVGHARGERNAKCPCGSGAKFKKCCGKVVSRQRSAVSQNAAGPARLKAES